MEDYNTFLSRFTYRILQTNTTMDIKHIIFRHLWSAFLLVGLVFLAEACGPANNADGNPFEDFPDDKDLAEVVSIVRAPSTADTVFTLDGQQVPVLQIARIFPTEHSDVFFSIRVFALHDSSAVNMGLARIISQDFATVSGGDIYYDPKEMTAKAVTSQIDYYGKVFNDTILPQLRESVVNGFYVNADLRPVWVSEKKDLYTYSSYLESASGGSPDEIECYYVTFSTELGRQMTFEDLVAADQRSAVRADLLKKIAADAGKTPEQYLDWLTDYINPGSSERFTVETFPISHVALYKSYLVFSYPQGTIAPVSKGCPLYFV